MAENINIILSRREMPFVGWAAIDEFEDLFSHITGAKVVAPRTRPYEGPLGRAKRRLLGEFRALGEVLPRGDLLLVLARSPADLNAINSVGGAKKNFRYIAAFIIDSYFIEALSSAAQQYDHIFCTTEIGADAVRKRFGVSSSVLRQGFDCLKWACSEDQRSIDLIGFGRQPPSYHRAFQARFHTKESSILYLHSPIGTTSGGDVWIERPMLLKLLQRSKISLAFHLGVEPSLDRPWDAGFVTSRWFESLASGCIVVGKKPPGAMAEEMFDWENATIELPDDPTGAIDLIAKIVSDDAFQHRVRQRNVAEMLRRHDWRYRMRQIYQQFELDLPSQLASELAELEAR